MMRNNLVLAVTGHRPDKIDGDYEMESEIWLWIAQELNEALSRINPKMMLTGMALGFDQLAAGIADIQGIPFTAAIPFEGQEKNWPKVSQDRYHELLKKATKIEVVSKDAYYASWLFQKRNEWMVDRCDILLALWDGSPGGTKNCINYAVRNPMVDILVIDPIKKVSGRFNGREVVHKQVVSP